MGGKDAFNHTRNDTQLSQNAPLANATTTAMTTADGRVDIDLNSRIARTIMRFAEKPENREADEPPPPYSETEWRTKLNIVVQVVGSRGDVQPFVALGYELKRLGHRVRIATHATFKSFVLDSGLEFYPIGGDPQELMAYMVKNPGLLPTMSTLRSGEISKKRKVIALMLEGCWRSCIAPDLDTHAPFVANAIIANPVSFAHVHCAQALGVPLHIMFTMPWSATEAFPHPLANIKTSEVGVGPASFWSYHLVSYLTWQGLADVINSFRQHTLGLEAIPLTEGPTLLENLKIPHTYCWSSALIPKPQDWPNHLNVTGFIFRQPPSYKPPVELEQFLQIGEPPIYIGFGSIVVDDPAELTTTLLRAVELSGVRAVISPGWSSLSSQDAQTCSDIFFLEGDCPHEWLFQHVRAVVHHGGAGTTACGLRNRQPTVVVSFFGDQLFWGEMIATAGAGPRPIPFKDLTSQNLAEAMGLCLTRSVQEAAGEISARMRDEDGVQSAAASFHRYLSADAVACDVLPEYPAAWSYRQGGKGMKLSGQAAEALIDGGLLKAKNLELYLPNPVRPRHRRWDPATGVMAAMGETTTGMLNEAMGFWKRPLDLHERRQLEAVRSKIASENEPSSSEENSQSTVGHAAELVGASLSSAPRFVGQMFKGFVVDVPLAVTEGLRSTPQLYGDKVEDLEPVTDWRSGTIVAGKNFLANSKAGAIDLWTQPRKAYEEQGFQGLGKGVAKGLFGSLTKTGSAITGLVAYPGEGIVKSVHSVFHSDTRKAIADARRVEARVWMHGQPGMIDNKRVVDTFGLLRKGGDRALSLDTVVSRQGSTAPGSPY